MSFSQYFEALLVDSGANTRRIASDEAIFREGDPGDAAYFIRTGSVDIVSRGPDGRERLLQRLGKGELFGEIALLDQTCRSASALAGEETELFVIARDDVISLLQREPHMALWMLGLSSHRLRVLTRMVSQMEQVQEVKLKILAGQEDERRRIGRDIHDGVAQSITESILRLQALPPLLDHDLDGVRSELENLEHGLRDSLARIRELIFNLFSGELRRAGLVGATEQFVDRIAKSASLKVSFRNRGLDDELPAALEATLYCIVQEALHNVRKHARASEVLVEMNCDDESLTLVISDDGCGFDTGPFLTGQASLNGYGLLSMQERTKLADGTMDVDSHPGAGTRLRFIVPIRARRRAMNR